jgi:hypothetical protein
MAPPSKKRKIAVTVPEKIDFDFAAREEYLTGFHKRKLARIKHAQEENAKREKEEKLRFRREVRSTVVTAKAVVGGLDMYEHVLTFRCSYGNSAKSTSRNTSKKSTG